MGFLSDLFFSKTGVPDVFWLILVGILIGPILHLVDSKTLGDAAAIFTSFALLFILFEGGLHIRIKDLMQSMFGATAIASTNFVLTVATVALIAKLFAWNWTNAILLGTILGGTSSAVVVPIVSKLKLSRDNSLILILESAFTDVLCIVATLTIVQIVRLQNIDIGGVLNSLFGSFAIAIFVGGIVGFVWIMLMERFVALTKSYISTIGILLIVYGITEFAHSSGAIAALSFGIVIGNSRKILSLAAGEEEDDTLTASAKEFFSQISFFVKTFFFVYIGILLVLTDIKPIFIGLLITIAVFFVRPFPVKIAYKKKKEENRDRPIMEVMIPKGLAAAVLAQIPLQQGIVGGEKIITPVVATIFFTIAFTTLMVTLVERNKYPGTTALFKKLLDKIQGGKRQPLTMKKELPRVKNKKKTQPLK